MDQDTGLICIFQAEPDLLTEQRRPGRASLETGAKSMVAESIGGKIPAHPPQSVCPTGGGAFVLSSEEFQIIALIISGYTKQEMARKLCFSEATIYRRTLRIIEKLGVANKLELVLYALSHRMVNWFPGDPD